jgi:hypothetical protein
VTEGRKLKERIENEGLRIDRRSLPLHDNNAEEPQHRRERNEEQGSVAVQGSVTVLHLRNKQQHQCKQQRENRSTSPPARVEVIVPPLCLSFTSPTRFVLTQAAVLLLR